LHLIALHPKDGDGDIVADHHSFTHPSRQYEHLFFLLDLRPPGFGEPQESAIEIYGLTLTRQIRENLNLQEATRAVQRMSQNIAAPQDSTESRPHQLPNARQCSIERRGIATTRLGKIGAAATAAPNLCGNRTN